MRFRIGIPTLVSGLFTIGFVSAVSAVPSVPTASYGGKVYKLTADSSFQQGCFPPCLCPIMEAVGVRGTFELIPAGFDGLYQVFTVSDVNWTASLGDPELRITGSGTYRIGGEFATAHRLQLNLKVGNNPEEHFDSGLVIGGPNLPAISTTISINGLFCFDTAIVVDALPVPPNQLLPYKLAADESTFQQGCFDPCACPLGLEQPLSGRFALVELRNNGLFTEYSVVRVRWRVSAPLAPTAGFPIRGFGTYTVGGEFAAMHRLSLELKVGNGDQTHFDSGLVPGGGLFPHVDAVVSINGIFCFDTVLHVVADPINP